MRGFSSLTARERLLVGTGLPLAVVVAAWSLVWVPLQERRAGYLDRIGEARLIGAALSGADVAPLRTNAAPAAPLPARVTASAEEIGVPLNRLEPEGAALRVTIGEVPFATLILWLAEMEEGRGIALSAIEIDRRTLPGTVTARALLEDAD